MSEELCLYSQKVYTEDENPSFPEIPAHQIPRNPLTISSWLSSHKIRCFDYKTILFSPLSREFICTVEVRKSSYADCKFRIPGSDQAVEVRFPYLIGCYCFSKEPILQSQSVMCLSGFLTRDVTVLNRFCYFIPNQLTSRCAYYPLI